MHINPTIWPICPITIQIIIFRALLGHNITCLICHPCKVTWDHLEAISSWIVFTNNFRLKRDADMRLVSLRFSRRDVSDEMQHDLLGWSWELHFWSDFDRDRLVSKSIYSDASRREKGDFVTSNALSFLVQKLFVKNEFRIERLIWHFWPVYLYLLTGGHF